MNKKNDIFNRILNSFLGLLLIFQSFAPSVIYAQEATSTATVEETPSPSVEPTPSPTQEPSVSPSLTLEPISSPEPSPASSISPEASPEITPSASPLNEPPTDQVENNSSPEPTVGQPNAPPSGSPNPSLTPEPSPSVEAEQSAKGHLSATILENTDAQSLQLDLTTQGSVSSASLSTDKADYAPTDTAVISGSDFPKQADLKLIILADNYRFEDGVKTDENGTFIYFYQLDGTYRPLYRVEAYDMSGALLAAVTFTDAPVPSSVQLYQWETVPSGSWITGNLGSSNSDYVEGETVPFRLDIGGLSTSGNPYTFSVCRDVSNGTKKGYTTLQPFDTSRPATPGGTAGPVVGGAFQGVNVTINSATDVGQGLCGSDQIETQVSFTSTNNSTQFVLWGGRLASPADAGVGAGNGASNFPGSSLHMKLLSPNKDRSINPGAIIELAQITVTKIVDSGSANPDQWCFNISPDPNSQSGTVCGPSGIFTGLPTGSYTITESSVSGYSFVSVDGTNCTFSGSTATASVTSATDATDATCNFHNAISTGTVIVEKQTLPDGAEGSFTFTGDASGTISDNGQIVVSGLVPGIYSSTETVPTDWDLSSITCDDTNSTGDIGTQTATFQLDPGETVKCIFTDTKLPKLTVTKVVSNDNGGQAEENDFGLSIGGEPVNSGETKTLEADASYVIDESGLPGYNFVSISGDPKCPTDLGEEIVLDPGDDITCTITNDDQVGSVTGTKWNDLDGDGQRGEEPGLSDWHIQLSENNDGVKGIQVGEDAVTDSNGNYSFEQVNAGSYFVCEVLQDGWMQTYPQDPVCHEVEVELGESSTAFDFGNFNLGQISGKKYEDPNGNGEDDAGEAGLANWTITLDKEDDINPPACLGGTIIGELCVRTTNSSGNYSFTGLGPGTYRVSEVLQVGWQQTDPTAADSSIGGQADGSYIVTMTSSGNEIQRNFGNRGKLFIKACKFEDSNGPLDGGTFTPVPFWHFTLNGERTQNTGLSNCTTFGPLTPVQYSVSELPLPEGWFIADNSGGNQVVVLASSNTTVVFHNYRKGTISGTKWNDQNGNSENDEEPGLPGWHIQLFENNDGSIGSQVGNDELTNQDGSFIFDSIDPGSYWLCEVNQVGWNQTYPNNDSQNPNCWEINLTSSGEVTEQNFGNQQQHPVLTLTKVNDKTGIDVSAGASVLYTLTVTLTGSPLSNVSVIDLPPAGFKYRSGSWTANSSVRGDLKPEITGEPTYGSPGTWTLGDMTSGETVTLTYIADIDESTDPGLYKDLAWSKGTGFDSSTLLANDSSGFFVGTEVNVVKNIGESTGVDVVREERGEVLGVSAELPATGINTIWLSLAGLLLFGGAGLILAGRSWKKRYE